MKLYDISQEVFTCAVYPGDPSPERITVMTIGDGALCNVTALRMCAHNGTHADAPYHFIQDGKTLDRVPLENFVGWACVIAREGAITGADAESVMETARLWDREKGTGGEAARRILIRGDATVTEEAARVFAKSGILLYGNESQTVGPLSAPMAVHLIMLGAEVVLLEGIRLKHVPEGVYLLSAAPLNLGGADGAPCRAVLMDL